MPYNKMIPKPDYCLPTGKIDWKKVEELINLNYSDSKVSEITGVHLLTLKKHRRDIMNIKKEKNSISEINKEYLIDEMINWDKINLLFNEKSDLEISKITNIRFHTIERQRVKNLGIKRGDGKKPKSVKKDFLLVDGLVDWDKIVPMMKDKTNKEISKITGVHANTISAHRSKNEIELLKNKTKKYIRKITRIRTIGGSKNELELMQNEPNVIISTEVLMSLNRRILTDFIISMKANPVIFEESYHVPMTQENLIKAYEDSMRALDEYDLFTTRDDDYEFLDRKEAV